MHFKELKFLSLLSLLGLLACTTIQRHPSSGYTSNEVYGETSYIALQNEAKSEQLQYAAQDLGILNPSLSEADLRAIEDRSLLNRLENSIKSSREQELYYRYRPYLKNDREKIAMLLRSGYEGKAEWLVSNNIDDRIGQLTNDEKELVEDSDIGKGMSKDAVKSSWGEPDSVEISGSQLSGNERWTYLHTIATPEGFQIEKRIVYFQAGRVAGWETLDAN